MGIGNIKSITKSITFVKFSFHSKLPKGLYQKTAETIKKISPYGEIFKEYRKTVSLT